MAQILRPRLKLPARMGTRVRMIFRKPLELPPNIGSGTVVVLGMVGVVVALLAFGQGGWMGSNLACVWRHAVTAAVL